MSTLFKKKALCIASMTISVMIALACTNTSSSADPTDPSTTTTITSMLDLPGTGQIQSYTDTFGEDSDYTINPPSYTDNGNGTITDNVTGLIWQKVDDDIERNWEDALAYAAGLSQAGYDDWRLPTKKELLSIVDYGNYDPAIDTAFFPDINSAAYWSSTTGANDTDGAWVVYFSSGYVDDVGYGDFKAGSYYVRCVRGGE